ncbi:MAG: efflux RND transporter periplasmic adaptor subunit [bacterium]|nr:efflux RND transporter periplasmic adaptor subunit [bacterium]
MSSRIGANVIVFSIAAVLAVAAVVLFMTSDSAVAARERAEARKASQQVGAGQAETVRRPTVSIRPILIDNAATHSIARLSGVLAAKRSVSLSAEVEAAVVEILASEHSAVEKGAVLLQLDTTLRRAAVGRAEAGVLRARAAHRLAKTDLERQRGLADRQVASASELDRALNQERASFASLTEARAALTEAREHMIKSSITAPFAGTVNWLDLEPGSYVRVGDRVAEILDLSEIKFEVGVSDQQVVALHTGDLVQVQVGVFPGETFDGRIASIGKAPDDISQRYPVEILLANEQERLLPGMLADAVIQIGAERPSIRIPRRATVREFELDYVFLLVEKDGRHSVQRRRISLRPVPFRPQFVEVVAGLSTGDRIAGSSVERLREGLTVSIEETP